MNRSGYEMDSGRPPGLQMSHVFFIVLAVHVLLIGGALGYNWMGGRSGGGKRTAQQKVQEAVAPEGDRPAVAFRAGGAEPALDGSMGAEVRRVRPVDREQQALDAVRISEGRVEDAAAAEKSSGPPPELLKLVAAEPARTPAQALALAPAPAAAAQRSAEAAVTEHVVQKGEMLGVIARRHHISLASLRKANGIENDVIRVGQKLKIPAQAPVSQAAPTQVASQSPAAAPLTPVANRPPSSGDGRDRVYTVSKGDTLWGIAKRFKVSTDRLVETNKISDPSRLRVGMKLLIPLDVSGSEQAPSGVKIPGSSVAMKP